MSTDMPLATMSTKGQLTVPAHLRIKHRLHAGVKVSFEELPDGGLVLRPKAGDVRDLYGIIKYDGPPLSIEDIDRGIAEAVAERLSRSRSRSRSR